MTRFTVRVQPGAKSDAIVGWVTQPDGREILKLKLRAPAVDGKANAALIEFLAQTLSLRRRQVGIDRGDTSREKLFAVEGLDINEIKRRTSANA